jgi:hypothetical protein
MEKCKRVIKYIRNNMRRFGHSYISEWIHFQVFNKLDKEIYNFRNSEYYNDINIYFIFEKPKILLSGFISSHFKPGKQISTGGCKLELLCRRTDGGCYCLSFTAIALYRNECSG